MGSFHIEARFSDSWNVPWLAAPSPKKQTTTRSSFRIWMRQGGPDGDGDAAAHDSVGAEVARRDVGNVHAPALALADPGLLAQELRHHPVHVHALADALPMTPVRGIDQVLRLDGRAHADAGGLFADAEMGGAVHLPECEQAGRRFPRTFLVRAIL